MNVELPLLSMPAADDLKIFGDAQDEKPRSLFNETFRTFDRRIAKEPKPTELIHGFLREGVTGFNAQPRGTKTMLMLDIAIGLCQGSTVLGGFFTAARPYTVGYVTEEDSTHRIRDRVRCMLVGRKVQASPKLRLNPPTLEADDLPKNFFLSVRQGLNFDAATNKEWLYKWIEKNEIEVLIAEPLRSLVSGTDSSYEAIKPWIDYNRALLRHCESLRAVIWGYHNTRPSLQRDTRDPVEQTSGFPIISAVETPYALKKLETFGTSTKSLLSATYQKDATDDLQLEITLESDDSRSPTWLMWSALASQADRVGLEWEGKILKVLREWHSDSTKDDRGPNSNRLWDLVGKKGIRRENFVAHVERLVKSGRVRKTEGDGKRIHYAYAGDLTTGSTAKPRKIRVRSASGRTGKS